MIQVTITLTLLQGNSKAYTAFLLDTGEMLVPSWPPFLRNTTDVRVNCVTLLFPALMSDQNTSTL